MSHGTDALMVAKIEFGSMGLPFPAVPAALVEDLGWVADGIYSTRQGRPTPYHLDRYVREVAAARPVDDYLLLGTDGHGFNAKAVHFYCVQGPLALFLQLSWGGVYMTDDPARISAAFGAAARLRKAAEGARAAGKLRAGDRLVVVHSDFYGGRWGQTGPSGIRWSADVEDPMKEAMAYLLDHPTGLKRSDGFSRPQAPHAQSL